MKLRQIDSKIAFKFMLLSLMVFVLACGGSQKLSKGERKEAKGRGIEGMREDFDPVDLNDDDIEVPKTGEAQSQPDEALQVTDTAMSDTIGYGYRVQIVQTTDPEEARNAQREAVLRFDADVYRVFDPPFYKVRVGDFVNWNDAENVQQLAIQRGFRDAWVVRTKVNLQKAYQWMDDL